MAEEQDNLRSYSLIAAQANLALSKLSATTEPIEPAAGSKNCSLTPAMASPIDGGEAGHLRSYSLITRRLILLSSKLSVAAETNQPVASRRTAA
jgi:hypothetical protein